MARELEIKGFAISIDALFATLLVLGTLSLIGIEMQTTDTRVVSSSINMKQMTDDAFASLDNSGAMARYLANIDLSPGTLYNPSDPENPGLYEEAKRLLPEKLNLKLVVTEYQANEDLTQCKQTESFGDCFGSPIAVESFPNTSLPGEKTFHGTRLFMTKKSAVGENTPEGMECVPSQLIAELSDKEELARILLQGEPEIDIETSIDITDRDGAEFNDTNPMTCYDNGSQASEIAKVTIRARNSSRDPIAVAMALDRSASMDAYDAITQEATGTFSGGTCQDQEVWVSGKYGNALKFDGFANYVACSNDQDLVSDDELTLTVWVKIDDPNEDAWRRILSKEQRQYYRDGYALRYRAYDSGGTYDNTLQFFGNGSNAAQAAVDLDTEWHHIAVVVSGTTGTIYVDGADQTTDYDMSPLLPTADYFRIGDDD